MDTEQETKDVAGSAAGLTDLGGPVVPAHRKLTSSVNLPPNNVIAHVESTGTRRRGRSSAEKFFADDRRRRRGRRRGDRVGVRQLGLDDFADEGRNTETGSEGHVTGTKIRQQAMNALEMEE